MTESNINKKMEESPFCKLRTLLNLPFLVVQTYEHPKDVIRQF